MYASILLIFVSEEKGSSKLSMKVICATTIKVFFFASSEIALETKFSHWGKSHSIRGLYKNANPVT